MGNNVIKRWGYIVLIISTALEMTLFPSEDNAMGCAMTWICWLVFQRIGLDREKILEHPFVWLTYLAMSLYRILPLPSTLLELKPIAFHFECSEYTFFYETVLYLFLSLTYYLFIKSNTKPHFLKNTLKKWNFYSQYNSNIIWTFGIIGILVELFFIFGSSTLTSSIIGRLLYPARTLKFYSILLFFPCLYKKSEKVFSPTLQLWIYFGIVVFLSFFGNARHMLIYPFATFILLLLFAVLKSNISYRRFFNAKTVFGGLIAVFLVMPFLTFVSDAMLMNRSIRNEVTRSELFEQQWQTMANSEEIEKQEYDDIDSYSQGWTEVYLDNFLLNRFANLRVTDVTMYHARRIGFGNMLMQANLIEFVLKTLPDPVLQFLRLNVSKSGELISRSDYMLRLSFNNENYQRGLRVTSSVSDGLATFGWWYFPIQLIIIFLVFVLIDSYGYRYNGTYFYSLYGLGSVLAIFEMYSSSSGGIASDIIFILRGYIQSLFIFYISLFFVKLFAIKNKSK